MGKFELSADPDFIAWLNAGHNALGVGKLLAWLIDLEDGSTCSALNKGDTEFEKGRANAYRHLREDIQNLMSDTGTDTGLARHGNGNG